jgi:hypothetical protein
MTKARGMVLLAPLLYAAAAQAAQDSPPTIESAAGDVEELGDYAEEGTFEAGGSVGLVWDNDLFSVSARPTVGWFVADRVELSLILDLAYTRTEEDEGADESDGLAAFIVEPSYHLPLAERLFLFGGIGLGAGYATGGPVLETVPRLGFNFELTPSAVVTLAARVPVIYEWDQGAEEDEFGTSTSLEIELGITTAW